MQTRDGLLKFALAVRSGFTPAGQAGILIGWRGFCDFWICAPQLFCDGRSCTTATPQTWQGPVTRRVSTWSRARRS